SLGAVIVAKKRELLGSWFVVAILMLISSLLMYSAEHESQPEAFRNAFSGLWWAVATLTTVGYGDIYPVTALGRLVGAFIAFAGLAAVAVPTGIISSGLMETMASGKEAQAGGQESRLEATLRRQGELLEEISARLERLERDEG
ncbi:MAG: two pore domain potassium channel family protein, partial [Kiritimatiellae bacterium]|nr:two pore domain potassium channel family protein [Kiritimatiellia bacterium]